jgi:hypothetical protein
MRRVIIESPYHADTPEGIAANVAYAHRAMLDSLRKGEAPMLSHLLYTQVLDDSTPEDRALGIAAGLAWADVANGVVVYIDHDVSDGMRAALREHRRMGRAIEYRVMGIAEAEHEAEAEPEPEPEVSSS